MKELMISAEEVVELAFGASHGVKPQDVEVVTILSAQQKFMKPVVNKLWQPLLEGRYPELLDGYVKPALACYVRYLMLTKLALSVGSRGVVQHKSAHFATATDEQMRELRRAARSEADTLRARAVEKIEGDKGRYVEYLSSRNILNSRSISSGVVL